MNILLHIGTDTELCVEEIKRALHPNPVRISKSVLAIPKPEESLELIQKRIAGIVRISSPIIEGLKDFSEVKNALFEYACAFIPSHAEKIRFTIGTNEKSVSKKLHAIGIEMKKILREHKNAVRFVETDEPELPTVALEKEHVLSHGFELHILKTNDETWTVSKTETAQDWKFWQHIDMDRPGKDKRSGILPVKLAAHMINIAGIKKTETIWDPFCGSGTIIMLAGLLGYEHVVGTDISEKAIADAKTAAAWVSRYADFKPDISVADATNANKQARAIVTEPYLGPALHARANRKQASEYANKLETMYARAISNFASCMNTGGILVMAIPQWILPNGVVNIDQSNIFPNAVWRKTTDDLPHTAPKQYVRRLIVRYEKIG